MKTALAILIKGDDPILLSEQMSRSVALAADGEEMDLGISDFSTEDYTVADVVDAAQTPPMFTTKRIVVARAVGRFSTEDLEPILGYLALPSPTTRLILTAGGGVLSRKLSEAVKRCGEVIDASVPTGKGRSGWMSAKLETAKVRLEPRAVDRLSEHLGQDLARLSSILEVLEAVYGSGARVSSADLDQFIGQAGAGAPWDLTDAIDKGKQEVALDQLSRLTEAGERHPLVVLSTLQSHYMKLLRLDGANCRDETEAAKALDMTGSSFPAKKLLAQSRKLGSASIAKAIQLLATADLDLRGKRDIDGDVVLEVLVARLARLGAR